jgi:hypothetical protein
MRMKGFSEDSGCLLAADAYNERSLRTRIGRGYTKHGGTAEGCRDFFIFVLLQGLHPQQSLERRQEAEPKRRLAISSNKNLC